MYLFCKREILHFVQNDIFNIIRNVLHCRPEHINKITIQKTFSYCYYKEPKATKALSVSGTSVELYRQNQQPIYSLPPGMT